MPSFGISAAGQLSDLAKEGRLGRLDSQMAEILTSGGTVSESNEERSSPIVEGVVMAENPNRVLRWEIGLGHGRETYVASIVFPDDASLPPLVRARDRPGGKDLVGTIIRMNRARAAAELGYLEQQREEEGDDELELDLIMHEWHQGSGAAEMLDAIRISLANCLEPEEGNAQEEDRGLEEVNAKEEEGEGHAHLVRADEAQRGGEGSLYNQDASDRDAVSESDIECGNGDDLSAAYEEASEDAQDDTAVSLSKLCRLLDAPDQPPVQLVTMPHTAATTEAAQSIMTELAIRNIACSVREGDNGAEEASAWPPFAWVVVCLVEISMVGPEEWAKLALGLTRGNAIVVPVSVTMEEEEEEERFATSNPPDEASIPGWAKQLSWESWGKSGYASPHGGYAVCERVRKCCLSIAPGPNTSSGKEGEADGRHFVSYCWSNSSMCSRVGSIWGGIPRSLVVGNEWCDPREIASALGGVASIDCDFGGECSQLGVLHWARSSMEKCQCTVLFVSDEYAVSPRCVLEGWHALSTNPGGFRNAEIAVVVAVVGRVLKETHNDGQDARGWQHTWLGKAVSGCARVDFRGISDREKFDDAIARLRNEISRVKGRQRALQQSAPMGLLGLSRDEGDQGRTQPCPSMERHRSMSLLRGRGMQTRAVCKDDFKVQTGAAPDNQKSSKNIRSGQTGSKKSPKKKGKETEIWLRKGDLCTILRGVKQAVARKAITRNKDKPYDLVLQKGETVDILRRVSAPTGEGVYIAEARDGTIGSVDVDKVEVQNIEFSAGDMSKSSSEQSEDLMWVRAPDGSRVRVASSLMEATFENGAGWQKEAENTLSKTGDVWLLRSVGLQNFGGNDAMLSKAEPASHKLGDIENSGHMAPVAMMHAYKRAIQIAVSQAIEKSRMSRAEGTRLLALQKCRFADFAAVLRSMSGLNFVTSGEITALRKAEERDLMTWCENTLGYLATLCAAQSRLRGRSPLEYVLLVVDISNLGYKDKQYTLSLDVSSQHEAGGVLVSYERVMWEDVMMQLDEGIGVSNLMIERSDTGDVISSEAHWQVLFDCAIEDWHGSGKMGGEMHLKASGLDHGVERPTIRNLTTGITLVVNTRTLDDRVWGRWGKQGLEKLHVRNSHAGDSTGAGTRSKKDGTQGGQVARSKGTKAGRCVELPGVESIRTVDNLRQRLCNQFGKCVVLVWVPCDINGRPKLLGQASLVRAITSNAAWNSAKNEVLDDSHAFNKLGGRLQVDAFVDAVQNLAPREGGFWRA